MPSHWMQPLLDLTDKLKVPKAMQPVFDTVAGIIDEFCRKHRH